MSTQRNVNDLTFTIPSDSDPADMPAIFEAYTDGMPVPTRTGGSTTSVTSEDINKIFDFNGVEAEDPIESKLTITTGEYWKEIDGSTYGFQFGVATQNDLVEIDPEEGAVVRPYNAVPPNSLAIITRISATTWLVVGGVSTSGPFIFAESLMGSEDYYAESK